MGEALIEDSPKKHALRSRLAHELTHAIGLFEPLQKLTKSFYPDGYQSAMLTGDHATALMCKLLFCTGGLCFGAPLQTLTNHLISCIQQSLRYNQSTLLLHSMTVIRACMHLTGQNECEIEVKTYAELDELGMRTNNRRLLYQNFLYKMYSSFWTGNFLHVLQLSDKHEPTGQKRISEGCRIFWEGMACLNIARHTRQSRWKDKGEAALERISMWEKISKWNWGFMALVS